jgi:hypothetical protein
MTFKTKEQRQAYWASQSGDKKISIGLVRSENNDKPWSIIGQGSYLHTSEQYGLPFVHIMRDEALKLKKKFNLHNMGDRYGSYGYQGNITLEEFRKLENSKTNQEYIEKRKQSVEKTKDAEKPKEDFQEAKVTFDQLKSQRVHGFPFFAYTGLKPLMTSPTDLTLNAPRNPATIKSVIVHYNHGNDTYDVTFKTTRGKTNKVNDIYADRLVDLIIRTMKID